MHQYHQDFIKYSKIRLPKIVMTKFGGRCYNLILNQRYKKMTYPEDIIVSNHTIKGYDDGEIKLYVYRPKTDGVLPCLVYFHGGGFALTGGSGAHDLAMFYAKHASCAVVFVDYRLSTNYVFPTSVEDCYLSYKWVMKNFSLLNIDADRIAIGGDSAGGALAACTTQMLRDRDRLKPCFQFLIYPVIDVRMTSESMLMFDDVPIWNNGLTKKMWSLYLRNTSKEILYGAPLNHHDFSDLPDGYLEVAEFDCLRDEGLLYAETLRNMGIDIQVEMVEGVFHGYDMLQHSQLVKRMMTIRIEALMNGFKKEDGYETALDNIICK